MPVYIGIIETLGEKLYTGQIIWLREYIQNAIDANANEVVIKLSDDHLEIRDNGSGMDGSELEQEAFGLGSSTKTEDQIGELGIGMFAGIGTSDRVIVTTKKEGGPVFVATFDVREFHRLKKENRKMLFDDAMKSIFKVEQKGKKGVREGHFTRIRFEGLNARTKELLSRDKLAEFIQTNINVPISEKFPWKRKVEDFLGGDQKLIDVTLIVGIKRTKPTRFSNVKEELSSPFTVKINGKGGRTLGKIWACYSVKGESFASHAFLVKFKGMTIGDSTVVLSRFHAKDSRRFLGEIVIAKDSGLKINTERSWFIDSNVLDELREEGKSALLELHRLAELDTKLGNGLVRQIAKVKEYPAAIKKAEDDEAYGEAERLRFKFAQLESKIKEKVEERATVIEKLKEETKTAPPSVAKETYKFLTNPSISSAIGAAIPKPTKIEPREQKRRNNDAYIRTMLHHYIIDRRLSEETEGKNMKDTTNNVFTVLDNEMKKKVGMPETQHDFDNLISAFMRACADKNEPIDPTDKTNYYQAFKQFMSSLHFVLRNPSAHTLMKDKDTERNRIQVLLIGDYALCWIDDWKPKAVSKPVATT